MFNRFRRGYLAGEQAHYGDLGWWAAGAEGAITALVRSDRLSLLAAKTLIRVRHRNAGYFPWVARDGTVMVHMAPERFRGLPGLPEQDITAGEWHRHCIEVEQRELLNRMGLWLTVIPDVSGMSRDTWNKGVSS